MSTGRPLQERLIETKNRARSAGAEVIGEEYAEIEKLAEARSERGRVLPGGVAPRDARRGGWRSPRWHELRNK
ncbi:MAG: hypothetical protein NVS1B11_31090 [Terriglobales bacterium]